MSKKKEKHKSNPLFWIIGQLFHVIWLFLDLIYRIISNLCCCICFCVPGTLLSLILLSLMLYGITADHQSYFDGIDNGVSTLNTNLVLFSSSIDTCAPMTNKLIILYNFLWKMLFALLNAIGDGLGITYHGNPIFQWAKQKVTYNYWSKKAASEKAWNDHVENALNTYGAKSLNDLSLDHQMRIRSGAEKAAFVASQSLPLFDIGTLCSILDQLFDLLIKLLNLFNVFFVQIFGKIITALLKFLTNNGTLPDIMIIFLKFILNLLLDNIPFAKCLRSPLALVSCMCTPTNSNLITRVDVWLVGCAFSTCDASQYSSGFVAIQYCIGLRQALDQLGLFGDAVNFLLDRIDDLVGLIDNLDDLISGLEDVVNKLLDLVGAKLEVIDEFKSQSKINHYNIKKNVYSMKDERVRFNTTGVGKHFFNQLHEHANNLPLYRHVPFLVIPNDTDALKRNDSTPLFNETFSFDNWISQYDYVNHPIYSMMYDINLYLKSNTPVAENFLNLTVIGYQVLTNAASMLMGEEDLSIEQMRDRFSITPFETIPYHWDRIMQHMELIQHNSTNNCYANCTNCSQEQLDACGKKESYEEYLERVRDDWKEYIGMTQPIEAITMTNESAQELYEKGHALHQQKFEEFQSFKAKNQLHSSSIGLNFNLQGQLAFLILGAGVISTLTCSNFCGLCCNGSFNVCSLLTSCCPLILVLLGGIIGPMLLNFFQNSYAHDDLISPYMQQIGPDLLNIYHETPSPQEIANQFATMNTLLSHTINNVVIRVITWAVRITVFGVPIIIVPEPQQGDTVMDWILSIIFNDYFANCRSTSGCANNGKCYRIRDITNPNAFCTMECTDDEPCDVFNGQCYRAPFLRPGICMSEIIPGFSTTIQPQCGNKNISSFPVVALRYTNGTDFKNLGGWTYDYIKSAEFRTLLYNLGATAVYWDLFWFRKINEGISISPHGLFFTFIHNMPVSIPGLDFMTPLTLLNHFLFPTLQSISLQVHSYVVKIPFEPFITIETAWKFNNWQEFPPYGKSIPAMWACEVLYTPQAILGHVVLGIFMVIIVVIVFSPFAFFFYILFFKIIWKLLCFAGRKSSSFIQRKHK